LLLLPLLAAAGCSNESSAEPAANARGSAAGGAPGGGAGGPARTVVLAATDVGIVRTDTVEATVAITGDLLPIETVLIKSRLEGDLEGVYVREGDRVSRGQLLARFEASEEESNRASAIADRAAARSELETARWNHTQSQELFKAGAIPERDFRVSEQAVSVAQARLAAADARVRSTASVVTDTRVVAPTSGTIAVRAVENGERVSRGADLFTLVRADVLELSAAVPARQAGELRAGQRVRFTADGRQFEGRVARISPTVDRNSRTVQVYVQVPNEGGTLKGNTFASGRVIERTAPGVLAIPMAAVRHAGPAGRPFVYRIAGQKLEQAPVTLGIVDEARGLAQVTDGLQEGDRIVTGNVGTLGAGMTVSIVGEREQQGQGTRQP
jgi:RND family efflux transporter MFP subunit